MTAPLIRRVERHEASRLAAFLRRLFVEAYADCSTPANVEAYLDDAFGIDQQTAELDDPTHPTWVVDDDGDWRGVLQLRMPSAAPATVDLAQPAQLHRIYLTTAAVGTGLGRRLLELAFDAARGGGADGLWLSVWQRAPGPMAFYQRAGFRIVGTTTFVVGDDPLHDWIMQRRIDAV